MDVAKKMEKVIFQSVYGIECGIRRYLEEENGAKGFNPLDNYDKR